MNARPQEDKKVIYRIRVKGRLDCKWQEWFEGFQFVFLCGETLLVGPVADQAALHGALAKIRDLGIVLVSIDILNNG